ncbi:hypothetical protein CYMTET_53459, partial [Cymbomonas tetramitiformis]
DVRALLLTPRTVSVVNKLLVAYKARLCQAGYGPYSGGEAPSTGLLVVYLALQLCYRLDAYGFGWEPSQPQLGGRANLPISDDAAVGKERVDSYHYYRSWGQRHAGNTRAHSFEVEQALLSELFSSKRLHPPVGQMWHNVTAQARGSNRGNLKVCRPSARYKSSEGANAQCPARRVIS